MLRSFYYVGEENIHVKASVFRSQRKTEELHHVNLDINVSLLKLDDAHCSCKAGNLCCSSFYIQIIFSMTVVVQIAVVEN